jgi:hypothetical protein
MITPAVLLTANGSLLISTSHRMARIVDRVRVLNEKGDELSRGAFGPDFSADRCEHVADQIRQLEWRSDRVRFALASLHLSFACFVGTSVMLALDVMLGSHFVVVPTALAITGVSLMFLASISLFREVRAALVSNREEIHFYRDLRTRRETTVASGVVPAAELGVCSAGPPAHNADQHSPARS